MFNSCYFYYADKYSGEYNLIIGYVNRNEKFVSGAIYEPVIDNMSSKTEDMLLGVKYAGNPLEFEVEIINPDRNIPDRQMEEIKEWLCGQDGYKKLTLCSADYESIYLKCLLIPEDDIRDVGGYRGIRCKLKNNSGFWYGEDKIITYTKADFNALTNNGSNIPESGKVNFYPDIKTQCNEKIYPIIKFLADDFYNKTKFNMIVQNEKEDFESKFNVQLSSGDINKEAIIDCEYGVCEVNNNLVVPILNTDTDVDFFYLQKGENTISINVTPNNVYAPPSYLSIIYTPKVRVGGF